MSILGLSSNSGDEPTGSLFVKFKPSANAWEEGKTEFDMTKVKIVFDMDSVKTGWMKWGEEKNSPPDKVWAEKAGAKLPSPGEGYKLAFSIELTLNDERRIWESNGTGAVMGLDAIYDEMAQKREGDKLPLCRYTKSEPVKIGMGSTRIPQFEIVEWVERPIALSSVDDAQSAAAEW
jgi:hypothetical protein